LQTSTKTGIGRPVRRREDFRLLTGKGCYSDDFGFPEQAYAVMMRSPYGHSRFRSIRSRSIMSPTFSRIIMTTVKTRIRVAPDGTLTGRASGLPPGEHEAEIALVDTGESVDRPDFHTLLARVHAIQQEIVQLPVLDKRSSDEIIGYNERGHFD
jgi:hypothetical protein